MLADPARADAVKVLAAGGLREELVDRLGADRATALGRLLLARTVAAAESVFGAATVSVADPRADGGGSFGQRAGAIARAAGDGERIVVVVPELPVWRPEVLAGALEDLSEGCAISVGAIFAGGFYLLAVTGPLPPALDLDARDWADRNVPARLMLAAGEAGDDVGMLRPERALRTAGDVGALLADPMTDRELRELLGG